MTEAFDPYRKWLGIPQAEQPPHHYRLLGIGLFEDDPDVIESAADQRMSHLRTFQAGAHSALSQKLLNEVSAAKVCLLSSERKAAYDTELRRKDTGLRRQQDAAKPPSNAPLPKVKPLPADTAPKSSGVEMPAVIVTKTDTSLRPAHAQRAVARRSAPVWWAVGVAGVLLCGLAGYLMMGRPKPTQTAAKPPVDERQSDQISEESKPEPKRPKKGKTAVPTVGD